MNVERADILGRVCAVRSIFLSSRDASPRRATLNARSMGAREVTGVIPGKIGQSGAEIFTNGCGKKAIFERRDQGKLDRRFRISRGFPTTSPACILCGNYPIRLIGHRHLVCLFNRFWKWAHKNVWSPVCQNYAGNAQLYVTFTFASSRRMCSQTERKKTGKVPSTPDFLVGDRFSRRLKDKTTARVCLGGAATACPRSRDRRDPRARPDFGSQTPGSMATDVDDRRHFGPAPRFLHKV